MKTSSPVFSSQPLVLLQFTTVYFLLAFAALLLPRQIGAVATLWPASALGVAYLRSGRAARAPALLACALLANLAAHLGAGDALLPSLSFAAVNTVEMGLAALLLQRSGADRSFNESPEKYLQLLLLGACVAPVAGATLGAALLAWQQAASFIAIWPVWYASSVISAIGMLPLALSSLSQPTETDAAIDWKKALPAAVLTVAVTLAALHYLPFPFLAIMMPLIIAAVKLPFRSTALLAWISSSATGGLIVSGFFTSPNLNVPQIAMLYMPLLLTTLPPMALATSIRQGKMKDLVRRQFDETIERNRRQLQTIIDHIPAMVGYWDADLNNRFGNHAYQDWFGVDPESMRGQHIRAIIGEQHYLRNRAGIEAVLRGESPMFERTLVDQGGQMRHTLVSYVPEMDAGTVKGFYEVVTDITASKQAQRDQLEAQTQLQGIIDAASEFAIIAVHLDGAIRVFSVGAERMLGYRAAELIGKQTPALFLDREEVLARSAELSEKMGRPVDSIEIFVGQARLGHADKQEWTFVRQDGSRLPVNLVVSAIRDADDAVIGYLGIANDITEQKQLQASLTQAKEAAEAASGAKSQFVANMSHEIRTPLNAVLGMTHLLARTPLSEDQEKYLDMIRVSGQALLNVLNDILDFSKIEAGRMELAPDQFQLGEMLTALSTIMAVNAGDKELELAIGIDPHVPAMLYGDVLRLQQVLINLTHNAIKFTEQGEVTLWVELARELPLLRPDTVWLRFSVCDTGIGMNESQQARLFSAFSQVDSSMTRRFGGSGLGLTISRRLVEMMHGTLDVHSTLGVGSRFTVTVPLSVSGKEGIDLRRTEAERNLRILVVDDNRSSRDYLSKTLRAWTAEVDSASCGADALHLLQRRRSKGERYDLALIDSSMPEMDGLSTMLALRRQQPDAQMAAVIMVSAFQRARLISEAAASQADAIMIKPVTGTNLYDILQVALAAGEGRQKAAPFALRSLPPPPAIAGARLLLVEDNHFNQIVARSMLEQAGAVVDVVDNGQKALDRLRAGGCPYDLVLMDVQMPVMDGFTATQVIRNQLQMSLPVLAMTAGVMPSEREQCLASGMNDFIAKPINPEHMLATIALHLPPRPVAASVVPPASPLQDFNAEPLLMATQDDPPNRKKILSLIRAQIERAPQQLDEARQAWQEGRQADAAHVFHTLRGSIGTLGARQFATASSAVERAILAGDGLQVGPLFEQAEQALQMTLSQAHHWLEQYAEQMRDTAPGVTPEP
jgi:two-component system sensor histidine kinase/response regulator